MIDDTGIHSFDDKVFFVVVVDVVVVVVVREGKKGLFLLLYRIHALTETCLLIGKLDCKTRVCEASSRVNFINILLAVISSVDYVDFTDV